MIKTAVQLKSQFKARVEPFNSIMNDLIDSLQAVQLSATNFESLQGQDVTTTTLSYQCTNIVVEDVLIATHNSTLNTAVVGANGMEVAVVADTFYAIHLICNNDGSASALFASTSFTAPVLPATYTKFRRIGSFYYTVANIIQPFTQTGREVLFTWFTDLTKLVTDGNAIIPTTLDCSAFVPEGVRFVRILSAFRAQHGVAGITFRCFYLDGTTPVGQGIQITITCSVVGENSLVSSENIVDVGLNRNFQYQLNAAPSMAGGITAWVRGFTDVI